MTGRLHEKSRKCADNSDYFLASMKVFLINLEIIAFNDTHIRQKAEYIYLFRFPCIGDAILHGINSFQIAYVLGISS